jgi:glutathione synthase/RimK-type ligase-like ATP-grasp enzyme
MLIALVTWSGLPELADDDRLLLDHLPARAVVWDDASIDWTAFDAIVIRSTWDYHTRIDEFRAWIDRLDACGAKLWNPPALLRWNTHKRYLIDLAARGVNVVPTLLASRVVIKPAVSATAYRTSVLDPFDQEMLVQPFIDEVVTAGEWSLIFFRGAFSHAVIKRARSGDFRVQHDFGGTWEPAQPDAALIEQAQEILQTIEEPWLYARVDGVVRDGRLLLMELEMTEPSLFLDIASAARFAAAIAEVAS